MKSHYGIQTTDAKQSAEEETPADTLCGIPCNTIFVSFQVGVINTWVIQNDNNVHKRGKEAGDFNTLGEVLNSVNRLVDSTFDAIGVRGGIKCEDRSLEKLRSPSKALNQEPPCDKTSLRSQEHQLRRLYDIIIDPIADLIHGDKITIVPEGPLWLAPFAAFMDSNSRFLSESFRIRVTPSLTCLRADVFYFLCCTRKRNVCVTPSLIVFQRPAGFPRSWELAVIG